MLVGMLVGVPVALGATRLLDTMLYGGREREICTYLLVIALLGGAAFLASVIPAFPPPESIPWSHSDMNENCLTI